MQLSDVGLTVIVIGVDCMNIAMFLFRSVVKVCFLVIPTCDKSFDIVAEYSSAMLKYTRYSF